MNILTKYILSSLMIMMSVQAFVCHADIIGTEISIFSQKMSNQAKLLVDPTCESLNPEPPAGLLTTDQIQNILEPIQKLTDESLNKYEIERQNENVEYATFSIEELDQFLGKASMAMILMANYPENEQSELMIQSIKTLNTMEPELFTYCFKFMYMQMLSLGIEVSDSFFSEYTV